MSMKPPKNPLANATAPIGGGASFRAERYGTIALIMPLTRAAEIWLRANLSHDCEWVDDAVSVELSYFPAIADGIIAAGFLFEREAYPN